MILDNEDIRKEMSIQFSLDKFKKRTMMTGAKDVHIALGVYGRDGVIERVLGDKLHFHLKDRVITLTDCELAVSADSEIAFRCMFCGDNASKFLREHIERLIDELTADYEVLV